MAVALNMPFVENNDRPDLPGLMGEVALALLEYRGGHGWPTDVVSPKARRRT
jgi:hypothetical protein